MNERGGWGFLVHIVHAGGEWSAVAGVAGLLLIGAVLLGAKDRVVRHAQALAFSISLICWLGALAQHFEDSLASTNPMDSATRATYLLFGSMGPIVLWLSSRSVAALVVVVAAAKSRIHPRKTTLSPPSAAPRTQ